MPRSQPGQGGLQREGQLNVIALPRDWANYGVLMDNFTRKYGIKITDANPDGSSQDAGLVQGPAQPGLQEPGRDQRRPHLSRRGAGRGVRGGAVQRGVAVQRRPRHRLLQAAQAGRQLRPGHRQRGDRAVRPDPGPHLVGLPAGLRGEGEDAGPEDRHPVRRGLRRLLLPGGQQDGAATRSAPRGGAGCCARW